MIIGSQIGLTKHKNGIMAPPFDWLSARAMQLVLLHLGYKPEKASNGKSKAAWAASRFVF